MPTNRSVGLDALRLIGVLAIVVGHTFESPTARALIYPWHVPIFFVLTGYLWRPGRSMWAEARRRWTTIMTPYFTWLVIIAVPLMTFEIVTRSTPEVIRRAATLMLGGTFLKNPYQAFWFMCALFLATVLYRVLIEQLGTRATLAVCLLPLPLTFFERYASLIPYSAGVAFMAVFFIAAGHAAQLAPEAVRRCWPIALVAGVLAFASGLADSLDMKGGYWGTPVVSFVAAAFISVGLVGMFERGVNNLGRGAQWISSAASVALVVVLTHGIPIYIIGSRLPDSATLAISLAFAVALTALVRHRPALGGQAPPAVA